ncbi:MAG: type II secretion system F family protein [Sedimentisphaerales bacterium]|nr:type II secretion system F family protein [Sedimentisphaerales bacterium]
MARFEYQALTESGRLMEGSLEASSHEQAGQILAEMKLKVNSITQVSREKVHTAIGRNEFMLFNQQLASLTRAGIPLEKGLRELSKDIGSRSMRKLVTEIVTDLESGTDIEQAFDKRQKHFPRLYGHILKAGVKTGRLSEMLLSLNRHLELSQQTRRVIFEAMCYPLVVLSIAVFIITFIFLIVVPQYEALYQDMDFGQLPGITLVFFNMARHTDMVLIILSGMVLTLLLIRGILAQNERGRQFMDTLRLKIPFIGRLYHLSILSRLADAMGLLIGAGCDIPESLRLGAGASGNTKLKQECELLSSRMEDGANIIESGLFSHILPRLFLYSVQLGAQRNELQDNLYSLCDMYSQQARASQAKLSAILLPLLLFVVGVFLGTGIVAMFMPLISMIKGLS